MVGGYILCNVLSCGVEASIFSYAMSDTFSFLHIPSLGYVLIVTTLLMIANLFGVDIFAKLQDVVAILLVGSMLLMGIIGAIGIGFGKKIDQPYTMATDFKSIVSMTAVAFWLFIGAEYVIPVSKSVKNAKRNVPLGMMIGRTGRFSSTAFAVWHEPARHIRENLDDIGCSFCGNQHTKFHR